MALSFFSLCYLTGTSFFQTPDPWRLCSTATVSWWSARSLPLSSNSELWKVSPTYSALFFIWDILVNRIIIYTKLGLPVLNKEKQNIHIKMVVDVISSFFFWIISSRIGCPHKGLLETWVINVMKLQHFLVTEIWSSEC